MPCAIEGMEEIVKQFVEESGEALDRVERGLVEVEREPTSGQRLAEIFRAVHTIKGNSGMLGYLKLGSVAHAGESLLGGLREGKLEAKPPVISGLLEMVDAMRGLLGTIERTGGEGGDDYVAVVRVLEDLLRNPVAPAVPATANDALPEEFPPKSSAARGAIRVDVDLLDRLMDLTGELVLARNQLVRFASAQTDSALLSAVQRLKRTTADIQDAVMKARLQPIGSVWAKFPRLARDLALSCGKQVTVEMEGSETGLDRALIEAIRDPLTHILRNAIDHGIETPEQRTRAGKPVAGHLRFRAFHGEGRVHVEISDDGSGIDLDRVRQCAVERGLLTAEQAVYVKEPQLANLVFAPGLSTAQKVSNVSGRGVGLDVVKTNIQRVGGNIELRGVPGKGTVLYITIPLTLAVLPVLIVSSGGQRFAIPQANLDEVLRLEAIEAANSVEQVCGAPVFRLRDRLLPLCFLDRELQLEPNAVRDLHIVVLQANGYQFGLVVDAVQDTEEIVVKPLAAQLRSIPFFAGAVILSDGRVALILDAAAVAEAAGMSATPREHSGDDEAKAPRAATLNEQAGSWMVFRGTTGWRFALPLQAVERLEEIPQERIERSCGQEVVQYRGEILPLLRVTRLFHEPEADRKTLRVAVLREAGQAAGLVMDQIEDIVREVVELQAAPPGGLLAGSAVIHKRVADVLNVRELLSRVRRPGASGAAMGAGET